MYLSDEEKRALNIISLLSTHNKQVVQDVLLALLAYITMECYLKLDEKDSIINEKMEITIPFLFKLILMYTEEPKKVNGVINSNISIDTQPLQTLCKEIVCIVNNEEPFTKKYFKRQNRLFFKKLLDITDIPDEEELNEVDCMLS